ncbi:phenazine biosynthesis-like domain-containing protein 1 [Trichonephila clavipes]|nr:phenazine biosynthesis-like domain-containing protein 1 [Trichonephila clavipes]
MFVSFMENEYLNGNESEVVEFETLSGILKVKKLPDNRIEMDFPAYEFKSVMGKCNELLKAIAKDLPVQDVVFSSSAKMYLIQFSDNVTRKQFEEIKVNGSELLAAEPGDIIGVIVTVKGSGKDCTDEEGKSYDFLSRFFAPWSGVAEDPVCGSSHCVLAPYWTKILNKKDFYGRFCSSRGGNVHIQLVGDRILLSGHAAVVPLAFAFHRAPPPCRKSIGSSLAFIVNPLNTNSNGIHIEPFGIDTGSLEMQSIDLKSENASQVAEITNGVYGADSAIANYVQFWFRRFRSGIFDVKDAPLTGRPVVEKVDKIPDIIEVDRHVRVVASPRS